MPGVQIPHCAAPISTNARCSGDEPPPRARPSTVTIRAPCAWAAGTRQRMTGSPSISTVHAPHSPSPQPSFVPVSAEVLAQHVEQPLAAAARAPAAARR